MMAPGARPGETPEMGLESRRDGSGRQKAGKMRRLALRPKAAQLRAQEKNMTNEEAKAFLERRIKNNKEMLEDRIEFLVDEARRFIDNMQDAKGDTWNKLYEVYDLLGTFRRYYEVMEATNMQTGAYEVALGLLEE